MKKFFMALVTLITVGCKSEAPENTFFVGDGSVFHSYSSIEQYQVVFEDDGEAGYF